MIPAFNEKGQLPPGVHKVSWEEFVARFAVTKHRRGLVDGMKTLITHLKTVQCRNLYVDGSFVTVKVVPNDYDACWEMQGVKIELIDPVLLAFDDDGKRKMQEKYLGDIRPDICSPTETDGTYLEFFQIGRDREAKGIVQLSLGEIEI